MTRTVATLNRDDSVACANCGANWNVRLLLVDIGRARLRSQGFICLHFDADCVGVNHCPHCELPLLSRDLFPSFDGTLAA